MKKPEYKIGDYVEFECKEIYFNGRVTIENKKGFIYFIDHESKIGWSIFKIKTRSGKYYWTSKIIRKLPINRDKNGRFTSKDKFDYSKYLKDWRDSLNKRMDEALFEKDCSCFNCDKCAEQMRAYYEKSGELKPKMGKNWGKIKDAEGNYHEFGEERPYYSYPHSIWKNQLKKATKTEEKKPSERISELFKKNRVTGASDALAWCRAIGDYLDEQFEKAK